MLVVGELLSLPGPRRAQERNNLAKGNVNTCSLSRGSLPSAGCAAAVVAAVALMNNAAQKESRVEYQMGHIFQPPTAMHELCNKLQNVGCAPPPTTSPA